MRVYRGRADTRAADRAAVDRLVDRVASENEPAVRVWRPHRQVAFGRRDAAESGYGRARDLARERGFPPVEREVGGRAVAYTGSTVAFARVVPIDDPRTGLDDRYHAAAVDLTDALAALGVDATGGEPPDAWCPGSHSLQATVRGHGRKLAGLAQRVRRDTAVVAGALVVADHEAVASVLAPVYGALGAPFDPGTVGSVALVGGDDDPGSVVAAVENALVGDAPRRVRRVSRHPAGST